VLEGNKGKNENSGARARARARVTRVRFTHVRIYASTYTFVYSALRTNKCMCKNVLVHGTVCK